MQRPGKTLMRPRQISVGRQRCLVVQAGGGRVARLAQQIAISDTRRQVIGIEPHRLAKRLPRGREISASVRQRAQFRQCHRMLGIKVQRIEIRLAGRPIVAVREQPAGLLQRALDHVSRFWKEQPPMPGWAVFQVPNRENPIFS